jgi:hypothetical protein
MSLIRDNPRKIFDIQIKKIILKSIKKNLEYDSNPFEKKIEDKINKFHKGKIEKEKEKKSEMIYDRESKIDKILLSLEKNSPYIKVLNNDLSYKSKSKLRNNLRRSSAKELRNTNSNNNTHNYINESFHFKDPSLINCSSNIEIKIIKDKDKDKEKQKENNLPLASYSPMHSFSPSISPYSSLNKKLVNDFAKKDLEKARKKREEKLKEYSYYLPQQNTIVNNKGNKLYNIFNYKNK